MSIRLILALLLSGSVTAQESAFLHEADILHEPAGSPAAMVKGRSGDDLYWLANTSNDDPRIFAMRADGSSVIPTFSKFSRWFDQPEEGKQPWEGFRLLYAEQRRWIDMTSDENYLYILEGETQEDGDAVIYAYGEIDPTASTQAAVIRRLAIVFPDTDNTPQNMALFADQNQLFLLAATESGVSLYRMETLLADQPNRLLKLAENVVQAAPNAAEMSPDYGVLAVLSAGSVTVFERAESGAPWTGEMHELIKINDARLAEASTLVWNSDSELLVGTTAGKLYRLRISRAE